MPTTKQPTILTYDGLESCPYLPGRIARLPMELPTQRLTGEELDERLADGYRRSGHLVYRTACPTCEACESIRVLVDEFRPNRTQRRTLRKGREALTVRMGEPIVDAARVRLYNGHKRSRRLGSDNITAENYGSFLVDTCCDTFELRYYAAERLIGVAVADRGQQALSAVYCYFDPRFASLSPGVFSILEQVELCRKWGLKYLYLGYFIAEPCRMTYKATFRPHERRISGKWERFD